MFPSSSKTALLLQCGWAFGPRPTVWKDTVGEAAVYGTLYHARIAETLKAGEPQDNPEDEVGRHIRATWPKLRDWLAEHEFRTAHEFIEVPWLYDVHRGQVRAAELDLEAHLYRGQTARDIGGTIDFGSWRPADRRLLVLDHKTGQYDPGDPAEHEQLLTLAVMAAAYVKRPQSVTLALHWAPRGQPDSVIRAKTVSVGRLELHARDLKHAFAEIGSGRLRPGPECERCPARFDCPTRTNALAMFKPADNALARAWTADEAAFVHERLAVYRDMARMLEAKARETIERDGPGIRPDGKQLTLVPRPYSQLSMASIRRALPAEEAEALIDELGARGCIETGERVELRAVKPPKESEGGS